MIDIGKKISFTFCKFFENVRCFLHLRIKFAKSANMSPKFFLLAKKIVMGSKKRRISG
jgi:hypothetical protein